MILLVFLFLPLFDASSSVAAPYPTLVSYLPSIILGTK